jgi:hypothetical protein
VIRNGKIRIRDPGWKKVGSGIGTFFIRREKEENFEAFVSKIVTIVSGQN